MGTDEWRGGGVGGVTWTLGAETQRGSSVEYKQPMVRMSCFESLAKCLNLRLSPVLIGPGSIRSPTLVDLS